MELYTDVFLQYAPAYHISFKYKIIYISINFDANFYFCLSEKLLLVFIKEYTQIRSICDDEQNGRRCIYTTSKRVKRYDGSIFIFLNIIL